LVAHHHPASELDPDFHDGKHKKFLCLVFPFHEELLDWTRIIGLMITFNVISYTIHIPEKNLTLFWVLPVNFEFNTTVLFWQLTSPEPEGFILVFIVHKVINSPVSGHSSPAIILATTRNIMNILMFLGGIYQKFTECREKHLKNILLRVFACTANKAPRSGVLMVY